MNTNEVNDMYNDLERRQLLKNAKGKRLLKKVLLEYSYEIIEQLDKNPEVISQVLEDLEIPEEQFFKVISGDEEENITIYDQTLLILKKNNAFK